MCGVFFLSAALFECWHRRSLHSYECGLTSALQLLAKEPVRIAFNAVVPHTQVHQLNLPLR